MLQIAVFVDAGYLHAQGSALLAGSAQRRERNRLNVPLLLTDIVAEAKAIDHVDRNNGQLPPDFDRPSLATARNHLERELSFNERRSFREAIRQTLAARAGERDKA